MQRPSLLTASADPQEVLFHHFNVLKPSILPTEIPATIELSVLRAPHTIPGTPLPTHVLFVESHLSSAAPLLLPIHSGLYAATFRADFPATESSPLPVILPNTHTLKVPVIAFCVPHPPTLPLLFLFALGLESSPHTELAYRLLPPSVVEEFPNSAAMSAVLARVAELETLVERNEGMWRNVLALGVSDGKVVELVGTVWSVTKEARRIRGRFQGGR
ncbi:hypothetical protein C0992_002085 [Termitomyces sp. T32_za158]|nr:hypothetical protein C0992_002085 [Termitomyces sp. T32_za158]